ncbi:MAG: GAF domain-containing protein, partial [Candidatus Rokubacteria bacterium]|nr:GAF domain-containing protein [Candidatus Rokubacteria bacterium]
MSIRPRLLLAFAAVLIPYLALVAIGVVGFRALTHQLHSIEQEATREIEGLTDLQLAILQMVDDYLITGDRGGREEFDRRLAQTRKALARMESSPLQDPETRQLLQVIGAQVSQIETVSREILAIPDPRTDHAAHAAGHAKMKVLDRLGDDAAIILSQFREIEHQEIRREVERGSVLARRAAGAALASLVLSLAGGMALAFLFARWLSRPLEAIAHGSRRIAQGDLSQRVELGAGGEAGEAACAFNTMAERLEASDAALRRTNEESEARRRQAEALAAVGGDLVQSLDLAVVGERIIESVCQLLRVRFSGLLRLEPESGDLVAVAVSQNVAPIFGPSLVYPKGTGAVGLAVKERRLVVSEDVLADPRLTFTPEVRARIEQASFRAVIALPLVGKEGVIGALGIGDEVGRVFDAEEIRLAQAFADQATLALENAHLVENHKTRHARLETLLDVNLRLSALEKLDSLLGKITEACGRLLDAASAGIRLVEGEELVVRATWGDAKAAMSTPRIRIGQSLTGIVAATGEPLIVPNPAEDARLIAVHREADQRLGHRAWLGVPIKVGERVVGVISIRTRREQGFTEEDRAIAVGFASQAAIALENARLFEEAQRSLSDLKAAQEQLVQGATMRALG